MQQTNMIQTVQTTEKPATFDETYTTTANISAGATSTEQFISTGDYYAYGPFDTLIIDNSDVVTLSVFTDHETRNKIVVPAQSSKVVTGLNFRSFHVKNEDGTTDHTAGTVDIKVQSHNELKS